MYYHPKQTNEKGAAMLLALFLVLLIGLLVPTVLQRAVFHHSNCYRESRYLSALQLAEGGVDEALWHLSFDKQKVWAGWNITNPRQYVMNTSILQDSNGNAIGEYKITINDPVPLGEQIMIGSPGSLFPLPITARSRPTILATAGVPDLTSPGSELREVQVLAKARTVFSLGLFSDLTLDLGGTTVVNSYDSCIGPYHPINNAGPNGDAGSNQNIVLNGTALIDGDASAGGTVIIGGKSQITGEVEGGMTKIDLPPVSDLVNAAKMSNDNLGIPKAIKSNGQQVNAYNPATGILDVQAGCTLTLPGGTANNPKIYYLKGGKLNGNSQLLIQDHVVIFTDGTLDFTGGTVINNGGGGPPSKFVVYSSGGLSTGVKINGGAGFAGAIYAPEAELTFTGGGNIFGAAVGGKINMIGNAQFHYDECLGDHGLIAFFEVDEWVEKAAPDKPTSPT